MLGKLFTLNNFFTICAVYGIVLCTHKPRGIPLSKKIFYDASKNFSCLDGSGVFPFHYVNDDYCDCEDASDEPGTSACPNGIFVCINYGHIPMSISSSKVNDGICDCCDTTDEYTSSSDCFNDCKEQGLRALRYALTTFDIYVKGNTTRQKYISEASLQKKIYNNKLKELFEIEFEIKKTKLEMEDLKKKAEETENLYLRFLKQAQEEKKKKGNVELQLQEQKTREAEVAKEAFAKLDLNKDGKIVVSEVQSFIQFDYDDDGEVSNEEAQFFMLKKEEITMNEFFETSWRHMKSAFIIDELTEGSDTIHSEKELSSTLQNVLEKFNYDISDEDRDAIFEEAALKRKIYADIEKKVDDVQSTIWQVKNILKDDYGNESEFFVLHNKCFEYSHQRYLYQLCPFDKVVQILKHNKDETLLGIWNTWTGTANKYSQMSYTKGLICWNGPQRSVLVNLQCGVQNEILKVSEDVPCHYVFEFSTPALCKDLPSDVFTILQQHIMDL